jgi:hypothetical protein
MHNLKRRLLYRLLLTLNDYDAVAVEATFLVFFVAQRITGQRDVHC